MRPQPQANEQPEGAAETGSNARYEPSPSINAPVASASVDQPAASMAAPPKKEEAPPPKPLSFLERSRQNRKEAGGYQPSVAPSMVSNTAKDLENIQRENDSARRASVEKPAETLNPTRDSMRYNPAARESTVGNVGGNVGGNELPMKLASVGNIN